MQPLPLPPEPSAAVQDTVQALLAVISDPAGAKERMEQVKIHTDMLRKHQADLIALEHEVDKKKELLEKKTTELRQHIADHNKSRGVLERQINLLAAREAEVTKREQALDPREQEIEAREKQHALATQRAQEEHKVALAKLDEREKAVAELERKAQEAHAKGVELKQTYETRIAEFRRLLS